MRNRIKETLRKYSYKVLLVAVFLLYGFSPKQEFSRISMHMLTKKVVDGKLVMMHGDIYYKNDGRMVTRFVTPAELIAINNSKGDVVVYNPKLNEVSKQYNYQFSTETSIQYYFLKDDKKELGLTSLGFTRQSSRYENDLLITQWLAPMQLAKYFSKAELAYQKGVPVFLKFMDAREQPVKKTYFYNFTLVGKTQFPQSIVQISYLGKDSTVEKTSYSNVLINAQAQSPYFDFVIPPDAKTAK